MYQETYSYQEDPDDAGSTIYNAYLFKPPGYRKWIRQKAHHWGVDKLNAIIEQDIKEERLSVMARIRARAKSAR